MLLIQWRKITELILPWSLYIQCYEACFNLSYGIFAFIFSKSVPDIDIIYITQYTVTRREKLETHSVISFRYYVTMIPSFLLPFLLFRMPNSPASEITYIRWCRIYVLRITRFPLPHSDNCINTQHYTLGATYHSQFTLRTHNRYTTVRPQGPDMGLSLWIESPTFYICRCWAANCNNPFIIYMFIWKTYRAFEG